MLGCLAVLEVLCLQNASLLCMLAGESISEIFLISITYILKCILLKYEFISVVMALNDQCGTLQGLVVV